MSRGRTAVKALTRLSLRQPTTIEDAIGFVDAVLSPFLGVGSQDGGELMDRPWIPGASRTLKARQLLTF
jgi:hypothetical protein